LKGSTMRKTRLKEPERARWLVGCSVCGHQFVTVSFRPTCNNPKMNRQCPSRGPAGRFKWIRKVGIPA
jgi:hypothetical protein